MCGGIMISGGEPMVPVDFEECCGEGKAMLDLKKR